MSPEGQFVVSPDIADPPWSFTVRSSKGHGRSPERHYPTMSLDQLCALPVPSLNPEEKRLAVETEDHPLDYIDYEGVIPAGEYGGGPMIVWDRGVWAPMGDPEKSLASGAFKFRLAGEKLGGGWMLARLKPKRGETKRNWLLFKERDQAADPATDILTARPESVKSGCRIEDLLAAAAPRRLRRICRRSSPPPSRHRRTATAGCTRSSSTATARWRGSRAARFGWRPRSG